MVKRTKPSRRAETTASWRRAFIAVVVASLIALTLNIVFSELRPGNTWGLVYGSVALAFLVGVFLWALRRRTMRAVSKLRLGSAQHWLQFHIYGGLAFLLLVLMHSGFRLPTGQLTFFLWLLSLWTVASGLIGLGLQHWIPRMLSSGLATEAVYERIPELIENIRVRAGNLIKECGPPVQALYRKEIAPALAGPQRRPVYYFDITGGIQSRLQDFAYVSRFLSQEDKERLQHLEQLYKTKLELDAHYTLQHVLRVWQIGHVPTSILLLLFVALHLFTVFYY